VLLSRVRITSARPAYVLVILTREIHRNCCCESFKNSISGVQHSHTDLCGTVNKRPHNVVLVVAARDGSLHGSCTSYDFASFWMLLPLRPSGCLLWTVITRV
jgi:hypothetical protein